MKKEQMKDDQLFVFCGDGLGVPGLPHKVSMDEAVAMGMGTVLLAAIENGNYMAAAEGDQNGR